MFQLISIIISFFREIFFRNKKETDFKSPEFNLVKYTAFTMVILSFVINLFAVPKLVRLAHKQVEMQEQLVSRQDRIVELEWVIGGLTESKSPSRQGGGQKIERQSIK